MILFKIIQKESLKKDTHDLFVIIIQWGQWGRECGNEKRDGL